MRSVPRNIDRPNRLTEFVLTFLAVYYGMMFTISDPLFAFPGACMSVYIMYKFTLNKPEGQAYRFLYQYFKIGKMIPNPRSAPHFEVSGDNREKY